jgi:preprotein translocase subunit Sec61beta
MAKSDRVRMPSGMAGLMRYGEEAKDQIKVKPKYVIAICITVVIVEFILGFFG